MDDMERTVAGAATKESRWANVGVKVQHAESKDTLAECNVKWNRIYALFGARGESSQDEVFAAVNLYFLRNGCSFKGKYRKNIETAGGLSVQSGKVVQVTGKLEGEIRQFLRGRLEDSYVFLKNCRVVEEDIELRAIAENAGVPVVYTWLLADWLGKDCPYFVGEEAAIYNKLRVSKIAAARAKEMYALGASDGIMEHTPEVKYPGANGHVGGLGSDARDTSGLF